MPEQAQNIWNVLLVEDDDTIRKQVKDFLSGETISSRELQISEIPNLEAALNLIREHKADLVILDVYRGQAQVGGDQAGVQILSRIKETGFVPVVLYTALPEGLEEHRGKFVRLVGKDVGGLEELKREIENLFELRIPQIHRAVVNHIDKSMSTYMWGFVHENWPIFEPLIEKPEFLRLIVQRLAIAFARDGINSMTQEVYGSQVMETAEVEGIAHPAEYYIKPPIGQDPQLGDIRYQVGSDGNTYLVVLWPSCDMVSSGQREPKTDCVLCAKATPFSEVGEVISLLENPSGNKRKRVKSLMKNRKGKTPDRFHYLPGVWDIPHLLVDFQMLENIPLETVRRLDCIASISSPYAEAMATRFQKYIGRIGTPDLDIETLLTQIEAESRRSKSES